MRSLPLFATLLLLPACASAQEQVETAPRPMQHGQQGAMQHGQMMRAMGADAPRIIVSATGTTQRAPEQAVVRLAVEVTAPTAQQAARQNATQMDEIIEALLRLDIPREQIQTVGYHMYPEYRHDEGRREPEIIGYRVMNVLSVTVDGAERAGNVIDTALAAGANRVDGLHFQLRDVDSARHEALRDALRKAEAEARVLASAAGMTLGAPIVISTTGNVVPVMRQEMAMARGMGGDMAAPTPVEPGQLEVHAMVQVQYSVEP